MVMEALDMDDDTIGADNYEVGVKHEEPSP